MKNETCDEKHEENSNVYNHDQQNDTDVVSMNRTMTMSSIMMFMAMLMLEL